MVTFKKTPAENLDYVFDFSNELAAGETLVSHSATFYDSGDGALSIVSESLVSDSLTITVSGGTVNDTYILSVTATSSAGRIYERGVGFRIVDVSDR